MIPEKEAWTDENIRCSPWEDNYLLDELIAERPTDEVLVLTHEAVSSVIHSCFALMDNREYMAFLQKKGNWRSMKRIKWTENRKGGL